jgi:hypothetical protein
VQNAALQLMIQVDKMTGLSIGNYLNLSRSLLQLSLHRPVVGIGYMSTTTEDVIQNFTADHDFAVKDLRLSHGNASAMSGPYLSLISLVKGWPR